MLVTAHLSHLCKLGWEEMAPLYPSKIRILLNAHFSSKAQQYKKQFCRSLTAMITKQGSFLGSEVVSRLAENNQSLGEDGISRQQISHLSLWPGTLSHQKSDGLKLLCSWLLFLSPISPPRALFPHEQMFLFQQTTMLCLCLFGKPWLCQVKGRWRHNPSLLWLSFNSSDMLLMGSCPFCSRAVLQADDYWDKQVQPVKHKLTYVFWGTKSDRKEFKYWIYSHRLTIYLLLSRNNI